MSAAGESRSGATAPAPGETGEPFPADRPRVVVFGWGNVSRGDDGLGPLLLARIEALAHPHVAAIEDFQLQLEHALDLRGADLALFVDASVAAPAPFAFFETQAREGMTHTSHAMAPEAVLDVFVRVIGETPPPAFVLGLRGETFDLGTGLGEAAAAHLDAAFAFVAPLLERPDAALWRAAAARLSSQPI
ncbi:MAG: hydrogenase maturation protease [Hyphomicrobiales bacterium]|nr:hydrogenase maturation protease [Hyphomicrobiales bacterium]